MIFELCALRNDREHYFRTLPKGSYGREGCMGKGEGRVWREWGVL